MNSILEYCSTTSITILYIMTISGRFYVAISVYCALSGEPTLSNAIGPASVGQTIGNSNFYTCAYGYISSGPTQPYFTCLAGNATAGVWSAPIYTCNRMHDTPSFFTLNVTSQYVKSNVISRSLGEINTAKKVFK